LLFWFFEIGYRYIVQDGLELKIQVLNFRHVPPCPASFMFLLGEIISNFLWP
jgi:hypothetical protein